LKQVVYIAVTTTINFRFPDGPQMLSARELQIVKEVLLILKPFEMTLKELEGDEYVTSSKVIPAIYSLKNIIFSVEVVSTTSENINKAVPYEWCAYHNLREELIIVATHMLTLIIWSNTATRLIHQYRMKIRKTRLMIIIWRYRVSVTMKV
jgi:hypothetical protein